MKGMKVSNVLMIDDLLVIIGSCMLLWYGFDVPKNIGLLVSGTDPYFAPRIFYDANFVKLSNLMWIGGAFGIAVPFCSLLYKLLSVKKDARVLYILRLVESLPLIGALVPIFLIFSVLVFNIILVFGVAQKQLYSIWFGESFMPLFLGSCLILAGILVTSFKPISWHELKGRGENAKH
jgi:hypothetical protein